MRASYRFCSPGMQHEQRRDGGARRLAGRSGAEEDTVFVHRCTCVAADADGSGGDQRCVWGWEAKEKAREGRRGGERRSSREERMVMTDDTDEREREREFGCRSLS